jgi:hypothetical protein
MRRLLLAAQLWDVLWSRRLEKVWINAAVGYQTTLAVAVVHYTHGLLERVAEGAAQRRAQKRRQDRSMKRPELQLKARDLETGEVIGAHARKQMLVGLRKPSLRGEASV